MARDPLVEQCTAHAKRTGGQRCRIRVRGGGVCRWHGETKAARAKRMERVALAEELANSPHRHPALVLLDGVHRLDVLARRAEHELADRGVTPATMKALVEATSRANSVAKVALDAGLLDRQVRLAEQQGALVGDVIRAIIGDLQLSDSQWELVGEVVPRHLRALTS